VKNDIGIAALALLASIQVLHGGSTNKTTHLTFSHPVEVPGVTLPAGTYIFRLQGSVSGSWNRVSITNQADDKTFANVLTVHDYRHETAPHTVVTFGEKGNCTEATPIKAWFYPNEQYGYRFVYPKEQAARIAQDCNEPVPETFDGSSAGKKGPHIRLVTPSKQEKTYSTKTFAPSDKVDQGGFDGDMTK
jgi:hypothetical protein